MLESSFAMTLVDMFGLEFEVKSDVPFAFFAGVTVVIMLKYDVRRPKGEVAHVTVLQIHRGLGVEVIAGIRMMARFHVSPLEWLVENTRGVVRAIRIRAVDCAVTHPHVRRELFGLTEACVIITFLTAKRGVTPRT